MGNYLDLVKTIFSIFSWPVVILIIFFTLILISKSLVNDDSTALKVLKKIFEIMRENIVKIKIRDTEFTMLKDTVNKQQEQIKEIVLYSMSFFNFELLQAFNARHHRGLNEPFKYLPHHKEILCFLLDHGYIEPLDIGSLQLYTDITQFVHLTPLGKQYVELRENLAAGSIL